MRRWDLVLAGAIVGFYVYTFPYYPSLRSANEMPRILLTQEIVDHRTFSIDRRMAELGSTFDVATTPDGHHYSNKAPGLSLLAVPAYLVLKPLHPSPATVTWAFRFTTTTMPALIFLLFFWRASRWFGEAEDSRRLALLAYAFGSMALPYAQLFMPHQTAAVCCGGAFFAAMRLGRERRRAVRDACLLGGLSGLAILLDYQSIFAVAIIGAYVLVRSPRRWHDAAWALAVFAVPMAILMAYHKACFGSVLKTGYSFAADPFQKKGVLGIVGPNRTAFWQVLLDPSNGIFILMPWLIIAVDGAISTFRTLRAEALACAGIVVAYIVFLGVLEPEVGRGGWGVGPRYMTVALPFAGWLACAGFDRLERLRPLTWGLVLLSVLIYVITSTTYPHWPTRFSNPLFEVSVRTLREDLAPPTIGSLVGLHGVASLLPAYALAAFIVAMLVRPFDRKRLITLALASVVAATGFFAYSKFPRSPTTDAGWAYVKSTFADR